MHRFRHAILRAPAADFAEGLTTVTWTEPPRFERLEAQHLAYANALREAGLALELLPALPGLPDAYFVEDVAIVLPELAILTRPGATSRQGEVEPMLEPLARHRRLARIAAPATLDGGDVLVSDRQVFVGASARTNAAGIAALREIVEPLGYHVETIEVAAGLHFKSSVNLVGPGLLVASAAFAEHPALRNHDILVVDDAEAYAANLLRANDRVLIAAGFPRLAAALRERGLDPVELDMREVAKMDGGLTCLSLRL